MSDINLSMDNVYARDDYYLIKYRDMYIESESTTASYYSRLCLCSNEGYAEKMFTVSQLENFLGDLKRHFPNINLNTDIKIIRKTIYKTKCETENPIEVNYIFDLLEEEDND